MVSLQAYTDDSASDVGDQRLFMAGYLNTAENWALFVEAWGEELRAPPKIDYLHMVEANNLRGQFKGWSVADRDEKLRGMARVIRHFRPISYEFSVPRREFYSLVKPVSPRGLGLPHFTVAFTVVSSVARYIASHGVKLPIDFIFDEQDGVSDDINLFFSYMKRDIPREARKLINGTPVFRDDRQEVPLQAADMLAWHVRREHELGTGMGTLPMAGHLRNANGHLISSIEVDILKRWAAEFEKMPAIAQLQTKSQWRKAKQEIVRAAALGYIPPHGTHFKNVMHALRQHLIRLQRRR